MGLTLSRKVVGIAVLLISDLASQKVIFPLSAKTVGAGLAFLTTILVARLGGAEITGKYGIFVVTLSLAATVCTLGMDQWLIRILAANVHDRDATALRHNVYLALSRSATAGLILSVCLVGAFFLNWGSAIGYGDAAVVAATATALVPTILNRIYVAALRGMNDVAMAQVFDSLVLSGGMAIAMVLLFANGYSASLSRLVLLYATCSLVVALSGWLVLANHLRAMRGQHLAALPQPKIPIFVGSFILVAIIGQALTDWGITFGLGLIQGPREVGAFRVAVQVVMVISMITITIENTVAPKYAAALRAADRVTVWLHHARGTRTTLLIVAIPIAICLAFPRHVLSVFGPDFVSAAPALQVLALGQLANAVAGPIGSLVIMSGNEKISALLSLTALAFSLLVLFVLAPSFGSLGAAWAYSTAIVVRNGMAYFSSRRRLPKPVHPIIDHQS